MLLARLRIRGKLALLLIVPLLTMVALAVPVVTARVDRAERAADTARAVRIADQVRSIVLGLQQERLLSIGHLVGVVDRSRLLLQAASVTDRITDLQAEFDGELSGRVSTVLRDVPGIDGLRTRVLSGTASTDEVMTAYGALTTRLIDALRLVDFVDTATTEGRQVLALDAVLHTDEALSAGTAWIVIVVATKNPAAIMQYVYNWATLQAFIGRFRLYATPEQNDLYLQVEAAVAARTSKDFLRGFARDPAAAIAGLSLPTLFPGAESVSTLGQFVEKRIITDVLAVVTTNQQRELIFAYLVGTLALLILVFVVLLSVAVARTVARPLTRLTTSAERVARVAEAELVRIADGEAESAHPIRLDPVDVRPRDEIGDLARAFERVQGTATRLVERQVASRRNVAKMFGHVGRRTQNLVGRQIALIDRLERDETDPGRLQQLYRLDHVSSRLRRNASSLVVLSGSASADGYVAPLPLADVVRLALGEVEDYTRVDVHVPTQVTVAPGVIGDLVLALAELMENATSFSPPHSRVTVSAQAVERGARLTIIDHGVGMSEERLAEENARLTRRERLDLVPTELLGLFVVGRLSRQHGLNVSLSPTPGGGVTAQFELGGHLLETRLAEPSVVLIGGASVPPVSARPAQPLQTTQAPPTQAAQPAPRAPSTPAAPSGADRAAFDVAAVHRATRSLESGRPWNAFAPRPGPATGHPERPAPTARRRLPRQRVPGGHPSASAGPSAPPGPADPVAARELVEEFEAGVRRAQRENPLAPFIGSPRDGDSQDREAAGRLPTRRVPGATLTDPARSVPLHRAQPEPLTPDEVRHLVTQFESGVARALGEVRSDHLDEQGSPR